MIKSKKSFFILNSTQKKRIKNNIFSGFSSDMTQVFSQIFFAPLMIFFWGIENFGIWLFLLSIPNIFLIFSINFTSASINEITMFNSQGNYKKANEAFQNSIVFTSLNIIFFTLLILLFYLFNDVEFSVLKNIKISELIVILPLLILSIYLNLFGSLFITGLQSHGKHYIGFNISNATDLLSKVSIVFSGIFFNSLVYPAIIYFIYAAIRFFLNFYFFLLHRKNIFFSLRLVSKKSLIRLFKLSIGHTAHVASNLINHSGIIFILGIFYSPYIVGYIATVKTLFYFFPIRFFTKLNHIIYYEIASLYAKKKFILIKNNFFNYVKFIFLLVVLFITLALIIGPFIYNLWLNNKYEMSFVLLLLIVFDAAFFTMRHSITAIFGAINKNMLLGILELILILIVVTLFYLNSYFGYSYLTGFTIILLGSVINLIFSFILLLLFFKRKNKFF